MNNNEFLEERDEILWGFAPYGISNRFPTLNAKYPFLLLFEPDRRYFAHWPIIPNGLPCCFCFSCGDCNSGELLSLKLEEHYDAEVLYSYYRKRHPRWSRNKIERAIASTIDSDQHKLRNREKEWALKLNTKLRCLRDICQDGPVTFVLDDGGSSNPDRGGTHGLGAQARIPKYELAYSINLSAPGILNEDFAEIPYWVPVTYFLGQ